MTCVFEKQGMKTIYHQDYNLNIKYKPHGSNTWIRSSCINMTHAHAVMTNAGWKFSQSGYDPNDFQLEIPNMDDWVNKKYQPNGNTLPIGHHDHVWKDYQGLNETFTFCEICDLKKDK
jgi:hypothetical protein